ncbi:cupin-like domain-containing protein [Nostoc sp. FACHB-133]|uniref:cupin-like domain-containing protein n=1 Tax=Nostoc sp. FACHB-133 TaxID=2692835 RepID=UPI0016880498|nr:cupin-like domain-containing protein [Nostoc sp. FACHB-133]MBD2525709.1 cupin-like domain-containing protein [Nostoc sp. FACHB-133]
MTQNGKIKPLKIDWISFVQQFNRFSRANQPIIITELDFINAYQWDGENLSELMDNATLTLMESQSDGTFSGRSDNPKTSMMRMSDYLSIIEQYPTRYQYAGIRVDPYPKLAEQVRIPESYGITSLSKPCETNIWVGGKGCITRIHFDQVENLNVQLKGRKKFFLIPPNVKGMRARSPFSFQGHLSHYNLIDSIPSPEKQTIMQQCIEVTLHQGEAIYIPFCWWHEVHYIDDLNINVNYWWFAGRKKTITKPRVLLSSTLTSMDRKFRSLNL